MGASMVRFARSLAYRASVLLLAALAGCAPTRVIERDDDVQTGHRTRTAPGRDRTTVAVVRADDDEATITLQSRETCDQYDQRVLHRTHVVERHASVGAQVLFYLGAAVGLGTGAWVVADVPNIPDANDPMTRNPVGATGATVIGALQLVAGATCLALGIGTSVRGRTSETDKGTVYSTISDSARSVECGRHVIAGEPVALVAGESAARVEIGRTDARGKVAVRWAMIGELFAKGSPSAAQVLVQGDAVATVDLDAARTFWAMRTRQRALELAQSDKVGEALAEADRAAALGADVSSVRDAIANAPTSIAHKREVEEQARQEQEHWRMQWGANFAEWIHRNRAMARSLVSLSNSLRAAQAAQDQYDQEKAANDEKVVKPNVYPVPLFPEMTGSFMFVKILDRAAGEALFEASDGLFVLHLSGGDSFQAVPGENVHMTAHNRGGSVLLTNGQRVPLFWSGHSPSHVRTTRGFEPNRSREHRLQQRSIALQRSADAAEEKLLDEPPEATPNLRPLKSPPSGARVFVTIRAAGDGITEVRVEDTNGTPVYCVGGDACGDKGQTVALTELRNAQ